MKMKKILMILLAMILAICSMTACKKSDDKKDDSSSAAEGEQDEPYKIGISLIDMENPYFITLERAMRTELEKDGCTVIMKDPGTDPKLQETQILEMLSEGIDALIVTPVDWEKISPTLKVLSDSEVKIINVDAQVKEMEYVDAYIGSDNRKAGLICGEDLIAKCPEGGKIAILECPTQNSINDRISGFEEALAKATKGFEVVARVDTAGEFEKGLDAADVIFKEHPDITAIMCGNDQLAVGAKAAANVAGLDNVLIYGVDGSPDIKKELVKDDNQIAGTAAQSPINMGIHAAQIALKILNGEEFEKETYEDVFMINSENVDMYGIDGWQ